MFIRSLRYLTILVFPLVALLSFEWRGWWLYSTAIIAFVAIPLVELLFTPSTTNLSQEEEDRFKNHWVFDLMIYLVVPFHFVLLAVFLHTLQTTELLIHELIGAILTMGIFCGVFGINIAHELGHRRERGHRIMSNLLLSTSLNTQFYVQHNRGHHRYVSTHKDPETARLNETLYAFWLRSVVTGYTEAWKIQVTELRKKNLPWWSAKNDMLWFQLMQLSLLLAIGLIFGPFALLGFIAAAIIGILLLATINYIEHYGLLRKEIAPGRFERVLPCHSWNSNHIMGRLILFELSRHSDHHYKASRKYQTLRHHDNSPQMPTGYPGMMILSTIPFLWFKTMNPRVQLSRSDL